MAPLWRGPEQPLALPHLGRDRRLQASPGCRRPYEIAYSPRYGQAPTGQDAGGDNLPWGAGLFGHSTDGSSRPGLGDRPAD